MTSGFTLIELLVVIAIISLLSSVVLASVQTVRGRANGTYKLQTMKQYMNAFELYRIDKNSYPTFTGIVQGTGYCLGNNNANSDCYNSAYSQNSNLNSALSPYIPGLPADTRSLIVGGSNIRGLVYQCTSLSSGICSSYTLRWFIEGSSPNCGDGTYVQGSGFLECIISR